MLEIGTGWGELAIRAARRGATVHTVTLSSEQQALAHARIAEAGFTDQVEVELCDYRARARASYDAVVSVEMIEAVGQEYWPTYFATIDRVLAPGGTVAIQAITMPHDRMLATRSTYTWINKYIFPGGFLPSVRAIDEITREHTVAAADRPAVLRPALRRDAAPVGRDASWRPATRCSTLGFDETFLRMWHFYLEYSRGGFASGYLDVQQLTFTRELEVSAATVRPRRCPPPDVPRRPRPGTQRWAPDRSVPGHAQAVRTAVGTSAVGRPPAPPTPTSCRGQDAPTVRGWLHRFQQQRAHRAGGRGGRTRMTSLPGPDGSTRVGQR